jgi:hypothetical protein
MQNKWVGRLGFNSALKDVNYLLKDVNYFIKYYLNEYISKTECEPINAEYEPIFDVDDQDITDKDEGSE